MTATESLLLVLDNDRSAYETCMREASAVSCCTDSHTRRYRCGDEIRDYVETITDDAGAGLPEPASLIVAQMYRHALDDVLWHEVAEHYLGKLAEQRQHEPA